MSITSLSLSHLYSNEIIFRISQKLYFAKIDFFAVNKYKKSILSYPTIFPLELFHFQCRKWTALTKWTAIPFFPLLIHVMTPYLSRNLFKVYSKCKTRHFLQSLPKGSLHWSLHCTEYYASNNGIFLKSLSLSLSLAMQGEVVHTEKNTGWDSSILGVLGHQVSFWQNGFISLIAVTSQKSRFFSTS